MCLRSWWYYLHIPSDNLEMEDYKAGIPTLYTPACTNLRSRWWAAPSITIAIRLSDRLSVTCRQSCLIICTMQWDGYTYPSCLVLFPDYFCGRYGNETTILLETYHVYTHLWTINEPHLPYKTGLDVMQSHPLCRTHFGQYQASSAALGWPGDGDCYNVMRRMQSGGWPYSKGW